MRYSGYASWRQIEAARKREERASRKRQKELERLLKEQAKLSALEQARLEVESFENALEVLLSVHKEVSPETDWLELLSALPSHMQMGGDPVAFEEERVSCEKTRDLAKRVLASSSKAYEEALVEFSSFGELSTLGTAITFRAHSARLIECKLKVNSRDVVPAELKSLTTAGRVSVRAMPKGRLQDLYQDYVCGCTLRVAREVLALLPVDVVIVTAIVSSIQARTGTNADQPVLSVAIPREALYRLDFARLDPSDAMANFVHRGDVKTSRKSEEFPTVVPLSPEDVGVSVSTSLPLRDLLGCVRSLRAEIAAKLAQPKAIIRDSTEVKVLS